MKNREVTFFIFYLLFFMLLLSGCEEAAKKPQSQTLDKEPVLSESEIERQNASLRAENQKLKEQLENLMGINKPARTEAVSTILSIELTDRCGIYDKDDDGKEETLVVYLRTIDDMGDCIKAPGAVKIELWDLDARPEDALLKSWEIDPPQLRKNWSGSLLTSYYKLKLDTSTITVKAKHELTIRVEFIDYMTGKILKAQQVCEP